MRLRLIQIPAAPSLGVYPTYRIVAALQEILRRRFLDAKLQLTSSSGDLPPLQPTVISFTPSPTFTLGRRQHEADLDTQAVRRLQAPLTVVARDEDAEQDLEGARKTSATTSTKPADSRHVHDSYTFQPAVLASPRGGLTTYHGPGQAVLWPVLDLKSRLHNHFTVRCYSRLLENTTADVLQRRFGVEVHTTEDPGLWVGGTQDTGEARKIAALGVHLRRNISALGVAVNLDMPTKLGKATSYDESINPWARFVPCGLTGKGVTCVAEEGRRRFGNVPASWDLQPTPFAAKWAAALATRLGLDGDIEVADDDAVRGLLVEARSNLENEGEDGDSFTVDSNR